MGADMFKLTMRKNHISKFHSEKQRNNIYKFTLTNLALQNVYLCVCNGRTNAFTISSDTTSIFVHSFIRFWPIMHKNTNVKKKKLCTRPIVNLARVTYWYDAWERLETLITSWVCACHTQQPRLWTHKNGHILTAKKIKFQKQNTTWNK